MPEFHLNFWRFDSPDWLIHPRFAPLIVHNISAVESWSGYALAIGGPGPARLVFPVAATTGRLNLDAKAGTVRMWFRPNWTSGVLGGSGPGAPARLLEVGTFSGPSALPSWSLQFDPDGSRLALVFRNGALPPIEILAAPTPWQEGQWHQVVLTYWDQQTRLYVDGLLQGVGPGAELSAPGQIRGQPGFALGGDVLGGNLAQGQFDELTTFGMVLDESAVAANYHKLKDYAALGPISPQENAAIKAMAEAAMARSLAQPSAPQMAMSMQPLACNEVALNIAHVPGENPTELELSVLGGRPGVLYDLLASINLNSANDWQTWTRIDTLEFDDVRTILPTAQGSPNAQFYQLAEVIDPQNLGPVDFYVSATAAPGGDGSRDLPFSSIQEALDDPNVTDCSVIQVLPGVYSGPNNRDLNIGDRHIVLVSERGWEQTIIDCESVAGSHAFAFINPGETTRGYVIGFTIRNSQDSAVLVSNGSHPLFANCSFQQNSSPFSGGAVQCNNAKALFVNCRFYGNASGGSGGALAAGGAASRVRLSHCSFSENSRANNGGTIHAANGASIELINSIVWSTFSTQGDEIQIGGSGGTVVANYCDIRGGFAGEGNMSDNPLFEAGGTRLTVNSPVIDQGTDWTFPGCSELIRYDMDVEARLDHTGFANVVGPVDIGADEYVYRLQFPVTGSGFSQVDEASGVVYLGSVQVSNELHPKIAIIDDEVTTTLYIYELNAAGSAILNTTEVNITHPSPPGTNGVSNADITDLEDITFDSNPARRYLYIATSLTKRNRYREVDNIATDPLIDPPSSDYDRRRTMVMRIQLDANFHPIPNEVTPTRVVWESENAVPPDRGLPLGTLYNTHFNAARGLIALIRNQINAYNARYGQLTIGSGVLIAWNTVDKFGTPVNGVTYSVGQHLPYAAGGSENTAGDVLGYFAASGNTTHTGLDVGQQYFYKIWAHDAGFNYYALPMKGSGINDGVPRIMINEFEVENDGEHIEFYNPAPVNVNIAGFGLSDDPFSPFKWAVPAGTVIPGRGYYLVDSFHSPGALSFSDSGAENMYWTPPGAVQLQEVWNMRDPDDLDSEGRAWDGGPRGYDPSLPNSGHYGSCKFNVLTPPSPFPPTYNPPTANDTTARRTFDVVPAVPATGIHLVWANVGLVPPVWAYTPKQHDNHAINLEGFGFQSQTELIVGLRSPLSGAATQSTSYFSHQNRVTGKALYFRVTSVPQFLPDTGGWPGVAQGITGPFELDLNGQGFRSIQWIPQLAGGAGRYLIIGGPANGGPLEKEIFGEKFSLYSWTGVATQAPQLLIPDLRPYTIRPEGVHLITVGTEDRVIFVEDRFKATGYATRNAVHWPLSILGTVQ